MSTVSKVCPLPQASSLSIPVTYCWKSSLSSPLVPVKDTDHLSPQVPTMATDHGWSGLSSPPKPLLVYGVLQSSSSTHWFCLQPLFLAFSEFFILPTKWQVISVWTWVLDVMSSVMFMLSLIYLNTICISYHIIFLICYIGGWYFYSHQSYVLLSLSIIEVCVISTL